MAGLASSIFAPNYAEQEEIGFVAQTTRLNSNDEDQTFWTYYDSLELSSLPIGSNPTIDGPVFPDYTTSRPPHPCTSPPLSIFTPCGHPSDSRTPSGSMDPALAGCTWPLDATPTRNISNTLAPNLLSVLQLQAYKDFYSSIEAINTGAPFLAAPTSNNSTMNFPTPEMPTVTTSFDLAASVHTTTNLGTAGPNIDNLLLSIGDNHSKH
ncbi:hypothetical protein B0T14DRAFT_273743 [Immersiella caudata]|uniref:Uncharacterized protein n=1 Tax=Immersiella caudata TaxID=314043 RepID=A0AA39WLQ9_9PEZI|nr:hypothetical protein B0T14DRAFT_273743 [Immersiella caudata]